MLTRRQLLKTSLMGSIGLVSVQLFHGCSTKAPHANNPYTFLTHEDQSVLRSIIPVMLEGAIPDIGSGNKEVLLEIVQGIDRAIAGLQLAVQSEVRELFSIMEFSVTRVLVAGVWSSWPEASEEEISDFLDGWKQSSFMHEDSRFVVDQWFRLRTCRRCVAARA